MTISVKNAIVNIYELPFHFENSHVFCHLWRKLWIAIKTACISSSGRFVSLLPGGSLLKIAYVTSFFLFNHRHSGKRIVEKMVNIKSLNIHLDKTFNPWLLLEMNNIYCIGKENVRMLQKNTQITWLN